MTGTDLSRVESYANASLGERQQYAHLIAGAGNMLTPSVRQSGAAGVFLMAETGAMLGIHPIAALQGVHVIDGKPTLSANLLAALVRRAGHRLRVSTSGSWSDRTFVARAELTRADDPDFTFVVEWGYERADRANLLGKRGPWQQYPEAMCKSRAITEIIREGAADVTLVPAYSPEELGANVTEGGEVIEMPQQQDQRAWQDTRPAPAETVTDATIEPDEPRAPEQRQAPAQREQADVVDADIAMSEDWVEQASKADSSDAVLAIYRAARLKGELVAKIGPDGNGEMVELGAWLIGLGQAMKAAELEGVKPEGEPAVLDGTDA